jgi:hypothetical protein
MGWLLHSEYMAPSQLGEGSSLRWNNVAATVCAAVLVLGLSACNSKSSSSSAAATQEASIDAAESQGVAQASAGLNSFLASDSEPASEPAAADSSAVTHSSAASDSSNDPDASAPAGFSACALLPLNEVESVTGEKFDGADAEKLDRHDYTCNFAPSADSSPLDVDVNLPSDTTTWDHAVSVFVAGGGTPKGVSGVGKRASESEGGGFLFDTGRYFISFQGADPAGGDKNAIVLAKFILTQPGAS